MKNVNSINIEKFKSVFVSINFLTPVNAENMSKNALLACVMKKGNNTYKTEKEINRKLAQMYSANIDIQTDKFKDYINFKVLYECVNTESINKIDEKQIVDFLIDYISNPSISNDSFNKQIVEREKQGLIQRINEEKDNKRKYAISELEKMLFEGEDYACSVLGDEKYLKNINEKELYNYYNILLKNSTLVVNVVGNLSDYANLASDIYEELNTKLNRTDNKLNINVNNENIVLGEIKEKKEEQQINQSVIAIGAKFKNVSVEDMYAILVYNQILGGSASSLMFQNVREKESLAYFAKSMYNRQRQAIYVYAGIEPKNYEKTKALIFKQFEIIKNGQFDNIQLSSSIESLVSAYNEIRDSKEETAKSLIANELYFGREVSIEEMIENIKKVTIDQVIDISKKIHIDSIFCLGGVTNG